MIRHGVEGEEEGEAEAEDMEEFLPIDQGTSRGAAHKRPAPRRHTTHLYAITLTWLVALGCEEDTLTPVAC